MLAVIVAVLSAAKTGIGDPLLALFQIPDFVLSDMNRYGHFLSRALWFAAYWGGLAVLVAVAAPLPWVRGTGSLWTRIKQAPRAMTPAVASVAGVALAGTAAAGGYIYWNTHILDEYVTSEQAQVDYEKRYRSAEKAPQPRIADIDMELDLYPDQRGFRSLGRYVLANRSDKPIELVHVVFGSGKVEAAELQDAELADKQPPPFNAFEFRPRAPFLPGETRTLAFAVSDREPGLWSDRTPVFYNGSFVHHSRLAPSIGVQREYYLQSDARRRAYGLEPLPGMASRDDQEQLKRNMYSADADFV